MLCEQKFTQFSLILRILTNFSSTLIKLIVLAFNLLK